MSSAAPNVTRDGGPSDRGPSVLRGAARDVGWSYVSVLVTASATLMASGLIVREAGAAAFGMYSLILVSGAVLVPLEWSISVVIVRAVARRAGVRTAEEEEATGSAHAVLVGLAALVLLAGAVTAATHALAIESPRIDGLSTLIFLIACSWSVLIFGAGHHAVLLGHRQFRLIATAISLGAVSQLIVLVVFIRSGPLVVMGIAQLVAALSSRMVIVIGARRIDHLPVRPGRISTVDLRSISKGAAPVFALGVGAQVVTTTDLIVVGALAGSTAAGLYRIGSLVPAQIIGVLYRGCDTVFPALARSTDAREREGAVVFLTRLLSYTAGAALGCAALLAEEIVVVLSGEPSHEAEAVLIIFALLWTVNATVHGLALVLIALERQSTFLPLVAVETIANLLLTIPLVSVWGGRGAAAASLVTLLISNCVVFPKVVKSSFTISPARTIWGDGLVSAALGAIPAVATVVGIGVLMDDPAARIAGSLGGTAVLASVAGVLLLGSGGRATLRLLAHPPLQMAEPAGRG